LGVTRRGLRFGSIAALVGAAGAIVAAVAGGVTEPTGIATIAAVAATAIAYGLAPLLLTMALRWSALAGWWALAAALLAAVLWSAAGMLFALPTLVPSPPTLVEAIVGSAPNASALWLLVASAEVVRAGLHRWSLVVVGTFVAVLIVGSALIELSGFDVRKVLLPLGWAVWMVDIGAALPTWTSPARDRRPEAAPTAAPCANCGAPRRTDGLAFCGDCGLPYRVANTDPPHG